MASSKTIITTSAADDTSDFNKNGANVINKRSGRLSLSESDAGINETATKFEPKIVWGNVGKFVIIHTLALLGILALPSASWSTIAFAFIQYLLAGLSVTAGAHRLWTHRSYKARAPLRVFLMLANCMAAENSIYTWSRDHRTHHKYSETSADPHDATRGFFFSHMGWLCVRKHPDVISKGSKISLADLEADPIVMFQHKHYIPSMLIGCFLVPSVLPYLLWNESLWTGYVVAVLRYVCVLHGTWLVNSLAHMWGDRPYDVNIHPSENKLVSFFAAGEGFHNYHHTFPHDYSASEWRYSLNLTTAFIDAMALVGQAYDRRSMSQETVERRIERTGPGAAAARKSVVKEEMEY